MRRLILHNLETRPAIFFLWVIDKVKEMSF